MPSSSEPQNLKFSTSNPQVLNLRPSDPQPHLLSLRSWSSAPHNLGSLTLDVSLISVPHVSVTITLIVTHPQIIDLTYSLSYSTVCNIRLCYRMFGLGETRIFKISICRGVTRIFVTLYDQNGRSNTILLNIMDLKFYDIPDFW